MFLPSLAALADQNVAASLEHSNYDTFSCLMSFDETVRRAWVPFNEPEYFLEFRSNSSTGVDELARSAGLNFPGSA